MKKGICPRRNGISPKLNETGRGPIFHHISWILLNNFFVYTNTSTRMMIPSVQSVEMNLHSQIPMLLCHAPPRNRQWPSTKPSKTRSIAWQCPRLTKRPSKVWKKWTANTNALSDHNIKLNIKQFDFFTVSHNKIIVK